jgi:hypothetical protein
LTIIKILVTDSFLKVSSLNGNSKLNEIFSCNFDDLLNQCGGSVSQVTPNTAATLDIFNTETITIAGVIGSSYVTDIKSISKHKF